MEIPCSVGRGGQAGEPWTGSLLLGAYESVTQDRNASWSLPGARQVLPVWPQECSAVSPRKDRACGRCEHSPVLPGHLLPGEGRPTASPGEPRRWGILLGTCLPTGRRPALLLKITGTGQPCWGRGSVHGARAAADRRAGLRAPGQAHQAPWRQVSPPVGTVL